MLTSALTLNSDVIERLAIFVLNSVIRCRKNNFVLKPRTLSDSEARINIYIYLRD